MGTDIDFEVLDVGHVYSLLGLSRLLDAMGRPSGLRVGEDLKTAVFSSAPEEIGDALRCLCAADVALGAPLRSLGADEYEKALKRGSKDKIAVVEASCPIGWTGTQRLPAVVRVPGAQSGAMCIAPWVRYKTVAGVAGKSCASMLRDALASWPGGDLRSLLYRKTCSRHTNMRMSCSTQASPIDVGFSLAKIPSIEGLKAPQIDVLASLGMDAAPPTILDRDHSTRSWLCFLPSHAEDFAAFAGLVKDGCNPHPPTSDLPPSLARERAGEPRCMRLSWQCSRGSSGHQWYPRAAQMGQWGYHHVHQGDSLTRSP